MPLTQERISLQLGIVNDVFSFEEGAAELISENDIEQEVGFYLGIDLRVIDGILLDKSYLSVNAKYSQIFSQPENLKFISIGLVYYLF